jgi:hypothetical protein
MSVRNHGVTYPSQRFGKTEALHASQPTGYGYLHALSSIRRSTDSKQTTLLISFALIVALWCSTLSAPQPNAKQAPLHEACCGEKLGGPREDLNRCCDIWSASNFHRRRFNREEVDIKRVMVGSAKAIHYANHPSLCRICRRCEPLLEPAGAESRKRCTWIHILRAH